MSMFRGHRRGLIQGGLVYTEGKWGAWGSTNESPTKRGERGRGEQALSRDGGHGPEDNPHGPWVSCQQRSYCNRACDIPWGFQGSDVQLRVHFRWCGHSDLYIQGAFGVGALASAAGAVTMLQQRKVPRNKSAKDQEAHRIKAEINRVRAWSRPAQGTRPLLDSPDFWTQKAFLCSWMGSSRKLRPANH